MLLFPNGPLAGFNQFGKAGNRRLELTVLIYTVLVGHDHHRNFLNADDED